MCGICGIYNFSKSDQSKENNLKIKCMCDSISHRGPDGEGIYTNRNVGLGHRRLSIIDLSDAGKQPMCNEDKSIWLVFNGEIYNFQELREQLVRKGHVFSSNTDSEVILHLYEEVGYDVVNHLRGMFAFCLYDQNKDELFLARDHFGKKPLVYMKTKDSFVFASEIKALLSTNLITPKINLPALHHYMTHSYSFVPFPETIFEGIYKLPPASYIVVKKDKVIIKKYWDLDYTKKKKSKSKFIEDYEKILKKAVRIREVSDVPLGVLLSGGVDSSSIVAHMDPKKDITSFGLGSSKEDVELKRASIVSKIFKTNHKEIICGSDLLKSLPNLVKSTDEPIFFMSLFYSYYLLGKVKEKGITVVLSGDGGDEIFAGYDGYKGLLMLSQAIRFTKYVPKSVFKLSHKFIKKTNLYFKLDWLYGVEKALRIISVPVDKQVGEINRLEGKKLSKKIYLPKIQNQLKNVDTGEILDQLSKECNSKHFLEKVMHTHVIMGSSYPSMVGDFAGMPHSLEVRSPLIDTELLKFAAQLPLKMKASLFNFKKNSKIIMKGSLIKKLPSKIVYAKKLGFGYNVKWDNWLTTKWRKTIENILFERELKNMNVFDMDYIQSIWQEQLLGKKNNSYLIWRLVVLEIWYEIYILNRDSNTLIPLNN
jgi:asparagine synthase (glutamine-hydrolysing)